MVLLLLGCSVLCARCSVLCVVLPVLVENRAAAAAAVCWVLGAVCCGPLLGHVCPKINAPVWTRHIRALSTLSARTAPLHVTRPYMHPVPKHAPTCTPLHVPRTPCFSVHLANQADECRHRPVHQLNSTRSRSAQFFAATVVSRFLLFFFCSLECSLENNLVSLSAESNQAPARQCGDTPSMTGSELASRLIQLT